MTHRTTAADQPNVEDLLLGLAGARDPDLAQHMRAVADTTRRVGPEAGLAGEGLRQAVLAATLHDVGKLALADAVLHKPGPLDPDERREVERHVTVGEQALRAVPGLDDVAVMVRASHERWDGRGYPDGLRGPEIPLGSRVVAVCDAFDAMRSRRSYAPPATLTDALGELERCAGSQFDPDVVRAFVRTAAADDAAA